MPVCRAHYDMRSNDDFFRLLLRYTAGEDVLGEITAAIAARPDIVYLAWGPTRPEHDTIPRELWIWCFRQAGYVPDGPVLLYRGCAHYARFGMSWTADVRIAELFSRMDHAGGPQAWNVYAHRAEPCEVLARSYVHSSEHKIFPAHITQMPLTWDEYVVDPAYLTDENVVAYAIHPGDYSNMVSECARLGRPIDFKIKQP